MKNTKWILGGGISGMIYAFYNRDYTIISPDLGGRLNHSFFENIIYLHHTVESAKFLNDLGVQYEIKTQNIKYIKQGKIVSDISKEDKISHIQKKINDYNYNPTDLNLSTSDYYIKILSFNYQEFLDKLSKSVSFIIDKVIRILDDEIICTETSYNYTNLISTIPAPVFWKLRGQPKKFKSNPTTFVFTECHIEHWANKFDLAYVVDDYFMYHRVSQKNGKFLYEISGEVSYNDCEKIFDSNILEHYVDYQSSIITDPYNIAPNNTIFLGRFAEWDHKIKQQDVLKKSLFSYDFRHVWNRQLNFSKNFIDLEKLKNQDYKIDLSKKYILALLGELAELLNEIPYKDHKTIKVNSDNLKIELIDMFKYFLNLCIIWDIDPKQLIDIFNYKSKLIEQEYESKCNEKIYV